MSLEKMSNVALSLQLQSRAVVRVRNCTKKPGKMSKKKKKKKKKNACIHMQNFQRSINVEVLAHDETRRLGEVVQEENEKS